MPAAAMAAWRIVSIRECILLQNYSRVGIVRVGDASQKLLRASCEEHLFSMPCPSRTSTLHFSDVTERIANVRIRNDNPTIDAIARPLHILTPTSPEATSLPPTYRLRTSHSCPTPGN